VACFLAWNTHLQGLMKDTFRMNNFHPDSPQIKILQSYILLQENKTQDVDQLCKQAMQILGECCLLTRGLLFSLPIYMQ
jgi:hypothetical protein